MLDTRIIISATWVVATLIYLYGDVLRIYHGGDMAKALAGMNLNQFVWLGIAVLMLTPILMVFLSLVLPQPVSRADAIGIELTALPATPDRVLDAIVARRRAARLAASKTARASEEA